MCPLSAHETLMRLYPMQVVGSPANWLTHLQDWSAHISLDVLPAGGPRFINASTWIDVIHPEVLRQCDALDGVGLHPQSLREPHAETTRPCLVARRRYHQRP